MRNMNNYAKGTFVVTIVPITDGRAMEGLGRMSIDKTFHGDLEGLSSGEMMSAGDPSKGSAGYVALERVEGTMGDKKGTFFLQHSATMDAGKHELLVTVVPGSGTEDFVGMSGTLKIDIDAAGAHSYTFEYTN